MASIPAALLSFSFLIVSLISALLGQRVFVLSSSQLVSSHNAMLLTDSKSSHLRVSSTLLVGRAKPSFHIGWFLLSCWLVSEQLSDVIFSYNRFCITSYSFNKLPFVASVRFLIKILLVCKDYFFDCIQ